ncbi:MAG TPA: NAD(P)/FAD-dependent oxidoreductase, partial [Sphingobacteriaceae bacterium]|nr:NAD(P)/FAD-dependent oxidoreductase [Sphingobacteriaceae bacterium]
FNLTSNEGTQINAKVIVIAAGLGSFEPRKPVVKGLSDFEGKGVTYMVKNPEAYRDKKVVLAGGGDSALDWTIFLADIAKEVTLVHRSDSFRGAPDSAEKVFNMASEGKIRLLLQSNLNSVQGNGSIQSVGILDKDKNEIFLETDTLIPLFGLSPKLGPIADWGLNVDKSAIEVNTVDYSTNIPGIFAIGDINTYPGKLKLILCGFHEGALMAQSAFKYVYPNQKLSFKYTTVNGINEF